MRKNLSAKAYVYPLPVLIIGTYDENGNPKLVKPDKEEKEKNDGFVSVDDTKEMPWEF